jgi:mono/diheme cytochrome c family protein
VFVAVIAGAGIGYVYSGWYNIAATDPHNAVMRWLLATTARESIQRYAKGIAPPDLADPSIIEEGAKHFSETCAMCHGAPGVERAEIGEGLKPIPPDLSQAVQKWTSAELFWIAKHGIKMTGMPAWGPTHEDDALWAMVAFIERLPEMTPERYQELTPAREGQGGEHAHAGSH